jgi:carboxyl-terminal processing protease
MKENGAVGVVFDLRSNPGGLLDSVIDMLSYILPTGKVLLSYQYKGKSPVFKVTKADGINQQTGEAIDSTLDLPMVVLCNEYSASAAEIFTSVIRDYRNDGLLDAKIVGKTTYKKGIMQASFQHPDDGSLLTITVAYYNPPSGENYHGIGITPDLTVDLPEIKEGETSVEDTQLKAGIEELKKLINENKTLQ